MFPSQNQPVTQVDLNGWLRRLRYPVTIELSRDTERKNVAHLLRGMTLEYHRPLGAAILRYVESSPVARSNLIDLTRELLADLPFRILELLDEEWLRRADRDINVAFGHAILYIDRTRRLPTFCTRQIQAVGQHAYGEELGLVAASFRQWDKALTAGLGSDWKLA